MPAAFADEAHRDDAFAGSGNQYPIVIWIDKVLAGQFAKRHVFEVVLTPEAGLRVYTKPPRAAEASRGMARWRYGKKLIRLW